MQNKDWKGYVFEPFNEYTLNQISDQNGKGFGQGALLFKGLHCKNWWYQIYRDPDNTRRDEAGVFHSMVSCPAVVDGELYELNITILAALKKNYFKQTNTKIELGDYLKNLAPNVISLFEDFQIHGKVSQNYNDIGSAERNLH